MIAGAIIDGGYNAYSQSQTGQIDARQVFDHAVEGAVIGGGVVIVGTVAVAGAALIIPTATKLACADGDCTNEAVAVTNNINPAKGAGEIIQQGLKPVIERTYTYGSQSYRYTFNPNKPTALGFSEDVAQLSDDAYNTLKNVPTKIYGNTNIQSDFMRDVVRSGIKPQLFSNPNDGLTRVFSKVEVRFFNKLEGIFGRWYK